MSYIEKRGKNKSWEEHVTKNYLFDLINKERIEINFSFAKKLNKYISKLIKWAKKDNLHCKRLALRYLDNKKKTGIMNKLFVDLKERYKERKGGYTRITKLKKRLGDNNLRVIFSLV